MAELRGPARGLRLGLERGVARARYRELLASLRHAARGPARRVDGDALRRPAPGDHAADGDDPAAGLLLLDEHTAALDPRAAEQVMHGDGAGGARAQAHDADGDAQHGAGGGVWRPDDHDASRGASSRIFRATSGRKPAWPTCWSGSPSSVTPSNTPRSSRRPARTPSAFPGQERQQRFDIPRADGRGLERQRLEQSPSQGDHREHELRFVDRGPLAPPHVHDAELRAHLAGRVAMTPARDLSRRPDPAASR